MFLVFSLIFLLFAGCANSLDISPCDDEGSLPNSLVISKCLEQPCKFTAGSPVHGSVNITVEEVSKDLDGELTMDHNGSLLTLPVPGVHRCEGLEREGCQFEIDDIANFYFMFTLDVHIPEEEIVSFKMVVKNEKGNTLSCCKFNGTVVTAPETEVTATTEQDQSTPDP
ncbi:uncharacterized protein LOC124167771 [Ischnura elegans]|uniref:uncharacterized protein LOC124167771 n=1 Tax=Ischnura elegans TaxID=197161 RepID=UPI001ED881D6|nr:uncharacterized protein LOC124167771 [Ischnura elegans]